MTGSYDVVVVGGGHNGLVAAFYLARSGLRVAVVERRSQFGGPAGRFEFFPGYHGAFTNSPGSLEPRIVSDMRLLQHGLRFERVDPTIVHPFADGTALVGWRDRRLVAQQLDRYHRGDAAGYARLLEYLERFARRLGVSTFTPPPTLRELVEKIDDPEVEDAFRRIILGSATDLLSDFMRSDQAKTLMAILAVMGTIQGPSAPTTAFGLLLRPLSMASYAEAGSSDDPRRQPLRGSTGIPVGSMSEIISAMEAAVAALGVDLLRETEVAEILVEEGRAAGVGLSDGRELGASVVISTLGPHTTLGLLPAELIGPETAAARLRDSAERGSAFKVVLAVDRLPRLKMLPPDVADQCAKAQFRIAPSVDYLDAASFDALRGHPSGGPVIWGFIPSATSPGLAPPGHHLISANAFHTPIELAEGTWEECGERFAKRCIAAMDEFMPGLSDSIQDWRYFTPKQIEAEFGLSGANITHGDMIPANAFGFRPAPELSQYRLPLRGAYIGGSGTWPSGYVSGVPGHNVAVQVLRDGLAQRFLEPATTAKAP